MKLALKALLAGMMTAATLTGMSGAAQAAMHQFTGRVVHVSTDNIKVQNERTGQTLSFLVVPHFDQVFQFDGKTTYQMKRLRPGMRVRVTFDQRALGVRHADRVVLLNRPGVTVRG